MAPPTPSAPLVGITTRVYLALCVIVAVLVQTSRLTPADVALPLASHAVLAEPWRLIAAFCYSDGLTVGFLLRLHCISCVSHTLEHVCNLGRAVQNDAALRSPIPLRGNVLYAACLLIGLALQGAAAVADPTELAPPFFLSSVALFLCYTASRLPLDTIRSVGGVGVPLAPWLPYAVLLACAMSHGASASLPLFGAIGTGVLFDCLDILPQPPKAAPSAAAAAAAAAAGTADGTAKRPLSRRTGATAALLVPSALVNMSGLDAPTPILPKAMPYAQHGAAQNISSLRRAASDHNR